ncbi:MAG: peptide chain release factor 2, partial [candidate division Zixibacteria bacterium]|nr:peptide chain release factor 2 [candidate division Zixibacteria bacterium]
MRKQNRGGIVEALDTISGKLDRLGGSFDIDGLQARIDAMEKKTTADGFWNDGDTARRTLKEITRAKSWVDGYRSLVSRRDDVATLWQMAADENDTATQAEATAEAQQLAADVDSFEFKSLLSGPDDHNDAIVTIHSGAGGTESCDWAQMLLRMYTRWMERHGFTFDTLDYTSGEAAGIKSATLEVKGEFAYGHLRSEVGVHRLVRISPFDANKRRHTSFASVFVLPEADNDVEITIKEEDIRIDTFRASGAGGQHVNKTSSAVRITHIPTGIVVQCQSERSQHKNRDSALKVLRARLYQLEREKEDERLAEFAKDKKKIEWGSQIRSYVFQPYQMVKDHRTGVESSNVPAVMDGAIDEFIAGFLSHGQ